METKFVRHIGQFSPSRRTELQRQVRQRYLAVSNKQASEAVHVSSVSNKQSRIAIALILWHDLSFKRFGTYKLD